MLLEKSMDAPCKTLSWSSCQVKIKEVKAIKRKSASNRKTAPVILWVRSSFTSSLAVTRESLSGFSFLSAADTLLFLDFALFGMDTKIIFLTDRGRFGFVGQYYNYLLYL